MYSTINKLCCVAILKILVHKIIKLACSKNWIHWPTCLVGNNYDDEHWSAKISLIHLNLLQFNVFIFKNLGKNNGIKFSVSCYQPFCAITVRTTPHLLESSSLSSYCHIYNCRLSESCRQKKAPLPLQSGEKSHIHACDCLVHSGFWCHVIYTWLYFHFSPHFFIISSVSCL